jgi:hypothetical protein
MMMMLGKGLSMEFAVVEMLLHDTMIMISTQARQFMESTDLVPSLGKVGAFVGE